MRRIKLRHPDGRRVVVPFCNSQYPKRTDFDILKQAELRPSGTKLA
jgi:hypothetical protein